MGRLAEGSVRVRVWAGGGVGWAQVRGQGAGARAFSFRASLGADVGRGVSGFAWEAGGGTRALLRDTCRCIPACLRPLASNRCRLGRGAWRQVQARQLI